MSKILVAYFSATGVTKKLAATLSECIGADLYEITPKVPYEKADLKWNDKNSRTTREMNTPGFRPEIAGEALNLTEYDTVFLGFPIWWYIAPTIINTFLEAHDFAGKTIIPFATSGGSGMGKTNENLLTSCEGAVLKEGRVWKARFWKKEADPEEVSAWAKEKLNEPQISELM